MAKAPHSQSVAHWQKCLQQKRLRGKDAGGESWMENGRMVGAPLVGLGPQCWTDAPRWLQHQGSLSPSTWDLICKHSPCLTGISHPPMSLAHMRLFMGRGHQGPTQVLVLRVQGAAPATPRLGPPTVEPPLPAPLLSLCRGRPARLDHCPSLIIVVTSPAFLRG